ncbi:serine hydrolase domain-containing protein [Budvicia diplopodorum]|uniref:serine hydrolase domain-containing protein n=1 Tax=Budvicia diplopodorum TaxID=1119056 RepID=UPI00135C1345|nr:serine hydrolase domain-containing protein [Budvicia diplopodorum]
MQHLLDTVIDNAIHPKEGLSPTIVGTVVLVSQCGKPLYQRAAGYADRENSVAMQPDTLFRLSSVTKPFVTAAVGVLLEQGKLHLDDRITKWLPWFTPLQPDGTLSAITIGHLLTHTAGLNYGFSEPPDGPYHQAQVSDGLDTTSLTLEENLRRIAALPLLHQPGTAVQYSVATDVLGAIIANVCNAPLDKAIRTLVTEPLGIVDSGFTVTDPARLAVPYINTDKAPRPMQKEEILFDQEAGITGGIHFSPDRIFAPEAFLSGGAGMVGTAHDVERLLQVLRTGGTPLFSKQTMELLLTDTVKQETMPGWGFAASWLVLRNPLVASTPQSPGTISWGGVYGHHWFVDFERDLSVVILTNTAPEGLYGEFTIDIRNGIYTALARKE